MALKKKVGGDMNNTHIGIDWNACKNGMKIIRGWLSKFENKKYKSTIFDISF